MGDSVTCTVCGQAGVTAAVCDTCRGQLHGQLVALPRLYAQLRVEAVRATATRLVGRSGSKMPPLPVPVDLLDAMLLRFGDLDGLAMLESYVRRVVDWRQLSQPAWQPTYAARIAAAAAFLDLHLPWIVTQTWVDVFADRLDKVDRGLSRHLEPNARWNKTRINCPGDGVTPCGAEMWVDSADDKDPKITCRFCRVEWFKEAWSTLGERVGGSVTIGDAAQQLALPYHRVYRWVERGDVPNVGTTGRPRVRLVDVLARHRAA